MPSRSGTCGEADVRELLARTDTYFSKVGLLPVVLPLPIQGECGALKRGLLRSLILCSYHIHSQLRGALTEQRLGGTAAGTLSPSGTPTAFSAQHATRRSSFGGTSPTAGSPSGAHLDPIEGALLPARILREKLRIFAWELGDEELQQTAGPCLLDKNELGLPALRKVLECLDSNRTEGALLLLCERRSPSISGGPYTSSLDTVLNATPGQRAERQELLQEEQRRQPEIHDLGVGVVAGGLVTVAATGQRQLMSLFCVEELPDDARHQLVRVLLVRVMALAFLWPSVFCRSSLQGDDDIRTPGPSLLHFPRPARDFLCLPSGLQLSRHFENEDVDFNHADQVRGCSCIKRMQRKVQQQQAGKAKQDIRGGPPGCSPSEGRSPEGPPIGGGAPEGPPEQWHEFWAVSKRRFYATWAQRGSQLVPDDPANSLVEAFDLPLKFPHEGTGQKSPYPSSPHRRRAGPRGRRGRGGGAPSSDTNILEGYADAGGGSSRGSGKGRGRPRVIQSRQPQGAAGGALVGPPPHVAAAAPAEASRCMDPSRPALGPQSSELESGSFAVKSEG